MRLPPYLLLVALTVCIAVGVFSVLRLGSRSQETRQIVVTSAPVLLVVEPLLRGIEIPAQLVPSGQELHSFQPAPSVVGQLSAAKHVIGVGGPDEAWLDGLVAAADPAPEVTRLIELLQKDGVALRTEEEHGELGLDPHVWLSPALVRRLLPSLQEVLVTTYPTQTAAIEQNARTFDQELANLDEDIRARVDQFGTRRFVAFHNAFSYFARDYGLEQIAVIEEIPGEAPTPGEIAHIQDVVRSNNLNGLFVEPQFSGALVAQLSSDLGVAVEPLSALEAIQAGDRYIDLMRQNLRAFEAVMGGIQ